MEPALLAVLREALDTRHRKEELERAIGRALRRRDMDFKIYVQMMSELRELANRDGVSIDTAAKKMVSKDQEGSQ